jgi:polar amino acid transport system substrate-binding protein
VATIVVTRSVGASAGSIMWNAVRAVDPGQREGSLALGFTERETFYQVVLPTAARRFLPLLSGQMVSLVKETSVVGYISVIDLTRATDLIRSRTMEAFFPLIVSAAIYFALCCAVAAILNVIIKRTDLNHRPREIKGVSA